ncbi:MAG: homoserine dehydrogenase [Anaerolineae bacterium]|nr:homoserine dehydrogenase [Anaerolineae bacterium]NIN98115.1 homoserine dehydrogenase [Anaerolineae bacterium]NIQ82948.1 homoserine dehydrogenase [Anaerolineae bacterium]
MIGTIRIIIVGLGNLGYRFCDLLAEKRPHIESTYGLQLNLVGAADSQGVAYNRRGLNPAQVSAIKRAGGTVAEYSNAGRSGQTAAELIAERPADLLCEASPVNLSQGAEPGLTHIRTALIRGMHVVTPNKGPLVVAYQELHSLAGSQGVELRFDGTVAGGLPALYLGQRDLRGAVVHRIEAVPNLVTGYILELLGDGLSWDRAMDRARTEGVLEADVSFDLDGWDAAAKLVILVNAVMGIPVRLEDVDRTGITGLGKGDIREARGAGRVYKLLATAERRPDGSAEMRVSPTLMPTGHFLATLGRKQMGVVYHTDIYGTIMAAIDEPTPIPSAATMLRDIIDIYIR